MKNRWDAGNLVAAKVITESPDTRAGIQLEWAIRFLQRYEREKGDVCPLFERGMNN